MGIKTFIREIRQEIVDEAKAEGRDEGYDKALNDLRALPPHEVLTKLGHHNGTPESEHPDNGKSPQK